MDKIWANSADSHVLEPDDLWRAHLPTRLVDRGPILIDGPTRQILWSAGPHPVREQMNGSANIALALPAFCHILRP